MSNKKYAGFTGVQWVVLAVLAAVFLTVAGVGPLADKASSMEVVSDDENDPLESADLSLDSSFTSVVCNSSTLANADTNFNEETNTVSLQVNAVASTDEDVTTFKILSKTVDGDAVLLHAFNESGTLTEPTTDGTVTATVTINSAVLAGFADTNEVEYSKVSASANRLIDTSGDYYYPFATRLGSTVSPEVKVDGTLDEKSYSWVATSTPVDHVITFKLSWTGINSMGDISDKGIVTIDVDCADDSPFKIEMVKNAALSL